MVTRSVPSDAAQPTLNDRPTVRVPSSGTWPVVIARAPLTLREQARPERLPDVVATPGGRAWDPRRATIRPGAPR